ncbi:expressed unknown protein [Seminavis robusta]|uniref:Uncharacterized protein n=1 Tax=Seminavis robusta TaxID=568900 RepID=A0A9N8EX51_9STRA|nr:expressed unknown protein [Seminavis robusta]|eukprot:Sro2628_g333010.1 n/a (480) ;mRNA; r:4365-5804
MSRPPFWWQSLDDQVECAITLEPVNSLPYPPFILKSNDTHHDYFDGRALASYIVSRGIFQNPLTRTKLSYDDCKRLDEYLDQYGHPTDGTGQQQQQHRFGVLEAFALRESVQVRSHNTSNGSHNPALEESRQRRSDFLRSEATAALSGLFVYPTQQRQRNQRLQQQSQQQTQLSTSRSNNDDSRSTTLGFDLNRSNPATTQDTEEDDGYGMVVIDDDDAVRVESEQREYQQLQDAFPRLSTQSSDEQQHNTNNQQDPTNERVLAQIRQQAKEVEMQELVRRQALAYAKHQLELEARQRKQQRQHDKEQARIQASRWHQKQQEEQAEMARARAEIEQWRNAQWERLQQRAQKEQDAQRERQIKQAATQKQQIDAQQQAAAHTRMQEEETKTKEEELEKEAKQKAAKAAKRKRAKDRKKAQKAQEQEEQSLREKEATLKAQKEASAAKCAHCAGGILGSGFDKFGHSFCSPKCARAGPVAS